MWNITSYLQKIVSIIFPARCFLCRKEGASLCDSCISTFSRAVDTPSPSFFPIFSFKDTAVRKTIHASKYYHRKDLLEPLATYAGRELLHILKHDTHHYTLIPIPMPRLRKYMRGYNQAEIIAQGIAKVTDIPVRTDVLIRTRHTQRQVQAKSRSSRIVHQKGSFAVYGTPPEYCMLVDDVTTTGATLLEATHTLQKAGSKHVYAITLAH